MEEQTTMFDAQMAQIKVLNQAIDWLFNSPKAQAEKHAKMNFAAAYRDSILQKARELARELASGGQSITADDVQKALIDSGHSPASLGNAAGAIFKSKEWECVGWVASMRVSNHGRFIRSWRMR